MTDDSRKDNRHEGAAPVDGGGVGVRGFARRLAERLGQAAGVVPDSGSGDDSAAWLDRYARVLGPLTKRRVLEGIPTLSGQVGHYGWAQLPQSRGAGFSIGAFVTPLRFTPLGYADAQGRVYATMEASLPRDTDPAIVCEKERDQYMPRSWVEGRFDREDSSEGRVPVTVGGVYLVDHETGERTRMATWVKWRDAYMLTDTRTVFPAAYRRGLSYRDMLAIAFFEFVVFLGEKTPLPFGSANVVRHLSAEAPLAAIRSSVEDIGLTRSLKRKVSGAEEYFVDLMREAGALNSVPGLEAEHGMEPLRIRQFDDGHVSFAWNGALDANAGMTALRIESALNRFLAVADVLQSNESEGHGLVENAATKEQVAQVDLRLLENPSLNLYRTFSSQTRTSAPDETAANNPAAWLPRYARLLNSATSERMRTRDHTLATQAGVTPDNEDFSEWTYRRTLSTLLSQLGLPFRMNFGFRSSVAKGNTALCYTSVSPAMMPRRRYDMASGSWIRVTTAEREAMAADYGLRTGMILAAAAFGADSHIRRVSVRMDTLGLDEARREQASAMNALIDSLIARVEQHTREEREARFDTDALLSAALSGESAENPPDESSNDSSPQPEAAPPDFDADSLLSLNMHHNGARAPRRTAASLRSLVTVTFDRERFFRLLGETGLDDPVAFYQRFDAQLDRAPDNRLRVVDPSFDIHDAQFFPPASQEVPELGEVSFTPMTAFILGCADSSGLAIQREDLLQRAVNEFHRIAADKNLTTVDKAHRAMDIVTRMGDPELSALSDTVAGALIDGASIPDLPFHEARDLDGVLESAVRLMREDDLREGIDRLMEAADEADKRFGGGNPLYFDSYAERIVYNRLVEGGQAVTLVPDSLYRLHVALASALDFYNMHAAEEDRIDPLPNLSRMIAYAPVNPVPREAMSMKLVEQGRWQEARALSVDAARMSMTRQAAAYAYFQLAMCEWMLDHFDVAAACDIMSISVSPDQQSPAPGILPGVNVMVHLRQVISLALSQNVDVPRSTREAANVLTEAGIPLWPDSRIREVLQDAERACTDAGLFIPAQAVARMRLAMTGDVTGDIPVEELLFVHSLDS